MTETEEVRPGEEEEEEEEEEELPVLQKRTDLVYCCGERDCGVCGVCRGGGGSLTGRGLLLCAFVCRFTVPRLKTLRPLRSRHTSHVVCSIPLEYCEFNQPHVYADCLAWRAKAHPELMPEVRGDGPCCHCRCRYCCCCRSSFSVVAAVATPERQHLLVASILQGASLEELLAGLKIKGGGSAGLGAAEQDDGARAADEVRW